MKANMGSGDKLVRLLLAIVLILLFYFEVLTGTVGIVALIVALILAVTSLINFCPLYTFLKINTCRNEVKKVDNE